jgi:hypothetical protein
VDTSNKTFEGDQPLVGVVLGMRYEVISQKIAFDSFREKLSNYILSNIKNGDDVVHIVQYMEDPIKTFEKMNKPTELSTDDAKRDINVQIHNQEIKEYETTKVF